MSDEKQKVRKDIQTYENQKKVKRLAQLGTVIGLGGMGYGGYTGNKKILLSSLGATLAGGYGAGRAQKTREQALGRIKKYYDLRDNKLINMSAVLPSTDAFHKHAMVGGALEALTGLSNAAHIMGTTGLAAAAAHAATHAWPFAIDLAATPGLANLMTSKGLEHAKVFAKHQIGKQLSPKELKMVGKAFKAKGAIAAAKADTGKLTGPLRRYFTGFFSGPAGIGSELGGHAGAALKHVGEISPRYQELGLNAINSEAARETLKNTIHKDLGTLNKGVEAAKGTRLAKLLTRVGKGSAPSLKHLVSQLAENPEKLEEMVNKYKTVENKAVAGGKAVGAGFGASILANAFGQMRRPHPLAKNELPQELSQTKG